MFNKNSIKLSKIPLLLQGGDRLAKRLASKSGMVKTADVIQPPLHRSLDASRRCPLLCKAGNSLFFSTNLAKIQADTNWRGKKENFPIPRFPGSPIPGICHRLLLFLLILTVAIIPTETTAQIRSGGAFLKIFPGVRNHGLAGGYTGVIDEMHTIYANPGATGFLREWQWATSYTKWIADSYHLSGLYGKQFATPWSQKTRFAFGIHYQGVGDFNSTGDPAQVEVGANDALPVSYKHLTLPTRCVV